MCMGIGGVCVLVAVRIRSIVLNDSQHRVVYWTAQYPFQAIIRSAKTEHVMVQSGPRTCTCARLL